MPSIQNVPTVEFIRDLLNRSDYAVEEAICRLHDRQTEVERSVKMTLHSNGVGFSGFDAEILSSFAEQIRANRFGRPNGRRLTEKQMLIARKRIVKYAGQLLAIAIAKRAEAAA